MHGSRHNLKYKELQPEGGDQKLELADRDLHDGYVGQRTRIMWPPKLTALRAFLNLKKKEPGVYMHRITV